MEIELVRSNKEDRFPRINNPIGGADKSSNPLGQSRSQGDMNSAFAVEISFNNFEVSRESKSFCSQLRSLCFI